KDMRLFERGIRRRFPTMVDGDRRRIELAYSLVFSLPGTPVLFYGEEIGLGENLAMPDREAVRPPMPWSDDPAGGFSSAEEGSLPRSLLADGDFGYRSLNVEQQRHDPSSLMSWMERAIRTRKEWPEFGWGEWRVLGTHNAAVLAIQATWDGSSVLSVHNFGDAPARATVRLPKDASGSGRWRLIFGPGDGDAPSITGDRLSLELPPYGYLWYGRRGTA
ncbi:MAG: DUF3459 domain-containing protein, partial [Chloroflexota bacterium]|nr:DUF3459 domain-containing protein [Chloroflexota bacterium]